MSQHWNELYAQTQDLYGTAANLFIQEVAEKIRIEGKTLAIAEGEGRNILYLAEQARQQNYPFSAEVWDYSDVALKHLSSKAEATGIKLELKNVDLTAAKWPSERYQNVICVFGHFDTQTQKQVLAGIRESLLNGGWFIGELYSKEQINYQTGGPKNIEYLYDPRSILDVFGQDHLHHFYVGEQERQEGELHCGKCHVIQFAIQVMKQK
ncbi:class I SAM-dependent methyltransferase [Acinetobacter sp. ANC 4862]|uniref:class I SAM-dependent methyltransferase n=1 Tax=Acinetobacter sp. ANC 4862 TaxID=2529849 RepID=UPI00103D358D|nr:class I SAM-dependent methyltransferase [Acinetobacter sp. ANC 4862]TCH60684.1 class I SAM-dependent methyltransferase [Acinetobacter sp. ANC 4862]